MGLDVTLGVLVLLAGARGWFRGFTLQAVRLGAVIGCVYLADPIRDVTRPYAVTHLPTIRPELLDRLLWWTAAAVAYVLTAGVATWVVKTARRRPYNVEPDPHRADQGAGFLLGAMKAGVFLAFLAPVIDQYATKYLQSVDWADEQVRQSQALAVAREYRPDQRIWTAPPVRQFVSHVKRNGLLSPEEVGDTLRASDPPAPAPPRSARAEESGRPRPLAVPRPEPKSDLDKKIDEIARDLERIESGLKSR